MLAAGNFFYRVAHAEVERNGMPFTSASVTVMSTHMPSS